MPSPADPDRSPADPGPVLTPAQCREIDRLAAERYAMPTIILMENAARGLADATAARTPRGGSVLVFAGPGNNAGDGLAAARHLHNRGFKIEIRFLGDPEGLPDDAATNLRIVRTMELPTLTGSPALEPPKAPPDAVIDALLGTGLSRPVAGPLLDAIRLINRLGDAGATVIAADIPSGLDGDTGEPRPDAVRAHATATFAACKTGLVAPGAADRVGAVEVVDIGVPRELIDRVARG